MGTWSAPDPALEHFLLIAHGPALLNAVVTGIELDVFGCLSAHPGAGVEDIGKHVRIPPHQLRVLLLALCAAQLVEKEDGRYTNSAVAEEHLVPDGPESWRHILLGWQRVYYPAFSHTTTALRTGTNERALADHPGPGDSLYARLAHDPALESVFHKAMSAFTLQSLSGLTECRELSGIRHLLDVGGGDGTTAVRIAERHPDLRVTVFDLPSVAGRAAGAVPAGLAERVRVRHGDVFADDFPDDADGVLFSHVLEVFSAERIQRLLAKAHAALPPGGTVLVHGYNCAEDESGGIVAARLSLYLNVLASGEGMAYPARDYEEWLRRAGFADVRTYSGLPYEHGLHVGVKPAAPTMT
ncbi:methyltransferase [Streptomyces sp. NPDC049577]|uniref:methyltransferase n=1 Tax=Streptomyces sp. NPDC049577 TaxID=3155153 RepID=UPI00343B0F4E